jgi:hypothetical protein
MLYPKPELLLGYKIIRPCEKFHKFKRSLPPILGVGAGRNKGCSLRSVIGAAIAKSGYRAIVVST